MKPIKATPEDVDLWLKNQNKHVVTSWNDNSLYLLAFNFLTSCSPKKAAQPFDFNMYSRDPQEQFSAKDIDCVTPISVIFSIKSMKYGLTRCDALNPSYSDVASCEGGFDKAFGKYSLDAKLDLISSDGDLILVAPAPLRNRSGLYFEGKIVKFNPGHFDENPLISRLGIPTRYRTA